MPVDAAAGSRCGGVLLFCIASGTDPYHAGITSDIVTSTIIKGLANRDAAGDLALTYRGRAVLRVMLPDL